MCVCAAECIYVEVRVCLAGGRGLISSAKMGHDWLRGSGGGSATAHGEKSGTVVFVPR